jgi:hypothetical protein
VRQCGLLLADLDPLHAPGPNVWHLDVGLNPRRGAGRLRGSGDQVEIRRDKPSGIRATNLFPSHALTWDELGLSCRRRLGGLHQVSDGKLGLETVAKKYSPSWAVAGLPRSLSPSPNLS